MSQRARILSSSLPHRSRVYNYLQVSPHKLLPSIQSSIPLPIQSATNINPLRFQSIQQQHQYELLLQFQLRRQKQKVLILQQRLKNKQSFIKQMKQFQDQLTSTFQKCQEDLIFYKKQNNQYSILLKQKQDQIMLLKTINQQEKVKYDSFTLGNILKDNSNINNNINNNNNNREYLEEIAQLKHLVIRLEQQINYYQRKQNQKNKYKNHSSSAQKQFYNQQTSKYHQFNHNQQNISFQNKNKNKIKNSQHKQRSKTLANEFNEKQQQNYSKINMIQQQLLQQKHKIASFLNHFLTMVQFFNINDTFSQNQNMNQMNLKQKLKKAWKWIKNVVVQWNHLKNNKIQLIKQYKIGNFVMKYLPLNITTQQAENYIEKIFKLK